MPPESPVYSSPASSWPPVMQLMTQHQAAVRESEAASVAASRAAGLGSPPCSHFPRKKTAGPDGPWSWAVPSWGRGAWVNKSVPLPSCPNSIFFFNLFFLLQWCAKTSQLDIWISTKALSSTSDFPGQCSPGVPRCSQEGLELVWSYQGPPLCPRSACPLPNTWVDKPPPSPLVCTAESQKVTFVHGELPNCCWGCEWGTSYLVKLPMSLFEGPSIFCRTLLALTNIDKRIICKQWRCMPWSV